MNQTLTNPLNFLTHNRKSVLMLLAMLATALFFIPMEAFAVGAGLPDVGTDGGAIATDTRVDMTVAKPETEKSLASRLGTKFSLSTCECGGEIMDRNADSGYCLNCGLEWTSALVYQPLYCRDFDDNEDDIPF